MFSRTRKRASPTSVTNRSTKSIKTFAFSNALPRTTTWLRQWIVIMPVVGTERGDRGGCGGKRIDRGWRTPFLLLIGLHAASCTRIVLERRCFYSLLREHACLHEKTHFPLVKSPFREMKSDVLKSLIWDS